MENLPEMELLQYIYKTADMGCEGIDAVEKHAEQKLLEELPGKYAEQNGVAQKRKFRSEYLMNDVKHLFFLPVSAVAET